jgi:hypothetical protein
VSKEMKLRGKTKRSFPKYRCRICGKLTYPGSILSSIGKCKSCFLKGYLNLQNGELLEREFYPTAFNNKLKEKIRKRDNYEC